MRADASRVHEIVRLCRERGLRVTGRRLSVAKVIDEAHDHPDINEVHRRAAAIDPRISLATVYRSVKLFEELGLVERHAFRGSPARLERAAIAPGEHHDHLLDLTTGRVVEFRSEEIERLQADIAARLGYRIVGHRLELYAEPLTPGAEAAIGPSAPGAVRPRPAAFRGESDR